MVDPVKEVEAEANLEVPYDTSNPEAVNKVRKKAARTRADRLEFIKAAMGLSQGRAWFYDILLFCKCFEGPYVAGDPYATAMKCGQQNIGLRILDDLQTAAPDNYLQMIKEQKTKNG